MKNEEIMMMRMRLIDGRIRIMRRSSIDDGDDEVTYYDHIIVTINK